MIHKHISELVKQLDKKTSVLKPDTPLELFGSKDSKFLKALKRHADIFGFEARISDGEDNAFKDWDTPYIADVETVSNGQAFYGINLDDYYPAVTDAIVKIMKYPELQGKKIAVVGRGYTARGLYEGLIDSCDSLTFVHSKTSFTYHELLDKNIIIVCSPKLDSGIPWSCDLVIDISGAAKNYPVKDYVGPGEVGKLTTSILLNRYATICDKDEAEE